MDNLKKMILVELSSKNETELVRLRKKRKMLLKKRQMLNIIIAKHKLLIQNTILKLNSKEKTIWKKIRTSSFFENDLFTNGNFFFKNNLRVDLESFNVLCSMLHSMDKTERYGNQKIPLRKRIAIGLYALGSSGEYRSIGNLFGVGKSTVCGILNEFCKAVWGILKPQYLNFIPLSEEVMKQKINDFKKMGLPQCIAAVDGCHIEVRPHKQFATDYYNYKGFYSIILFAAVDSSYKFLYINVGCPGRCNDSTIYENSSLKKYMQTNEIIKKNKINIKSVSIKPFLIGHSAFKLSPQIMIPFSFNIDASPAEKNFNYRLSKCRRVVENAFGHLKARFHRIGKGVDNVIENAPAVVKAACVLHNFLISRKDEPLQCWLQNTSANTQNARDQQFVLTTSRGEMIRNAISMEINDEVDGDGGLASDSGIVGCDYVG